ncbi:hypothetical protein CGI99_22910 [Vibrio parahaemolyticus]|nr:hypothetical protein AL464_24600 [Vibrio parahaemolyticus]EGQ9318412.1 hypothetical protein [Vibrio parahaemolyticus]EGR1393898.1 hypothetical protein [Vibrio parahaemolyticus]OXD44046.1 hypothetical protein CA160_17970 [Vibrio parahaemolyticus]OYR33314.1 hypothetical protein YB08_24160 [Vibrio parahaemolyticus]
MPFFTVFKLAKDSGFELEQPRQRAKFKVRNRRHQRNRARELAQKLETVNGEIKAKITHIVPPERT